MPLYAKEDLTGIITNFAKITVSVKYLESIGIKANRKKIAKILDTNESYLGHTFFKGQAPGAITFESFLDEKISRIPIHIREIATGKTQNFHSIMSVERYLESINIKANRKHISRILDTNEPYVGFTYHRGQAPKN